MRTQEELDWLYRARNVLEKVAADRAGQSVQAPPKPARKEYVRTAPLKEMVHGEGRGWYDRGCRCIPCREGCARAVREQQKRYRINKRKKEGRDYNGK